MSDMTIRRGRHDRIEAHTGDLPATLVEISSAIDTITEGATLEAALTTVAERLIALEERGTYVKRFSIDATIA